MTEQSLVVVKEGDDKLGILDEAATESGLFEVLERTFRRSAKPREEFAIAVKPNFMVVTAVADPSNATDTEMVVHLLRRFHELGYRRLCVVESENVLSQWYKNRSVEFVAERAGYRQEFYTVSNLTRDAVPHHYRGILGRHFVGAAWKDADFRISFAKNKTHPAGTYTLTLKNVFGTTVFDNKYLDYHKRLEWDLCVVDMLDSFPVHFGLVDAYWSADGPFGFRGAKRPKKTKTVIAARDLVAGDWVGAQKMGLDPMRSRLMRKVVAKWGKPSPRVSGPESVYPGWRVPPAFLPYFDDILEEWYAAHSFFTHCIMLPPDPEFPEYGAGFFGLLRAVLGLRFPRRSRAGA